MEEEGGGGPRLSKRFPDKFGGSSSSNTIGGGEVDYKTKAGTAWSHNFLNQKPWHPLSYPNQRRKWIAEQTHAQKQRRTEEVSREFAQEQEFFRQTALVSRKEKEKMEMMKAVSFMYVRPPGYNAESAKAAEIADEKRQQDQSIDAPDPIAAPPPVDKKKSRPKDVFGRALPTEEEFEVLKNAPRLETGAPARVKPFAVEIRNVRCVRCGTFGHQSGDRECPLKDAIMPNEESRLKRDDPLTAIMAQTDSGEPLKWELKQRPGMSPPRGGFRSDDPNQQIVAEDIFDEYGGFLSGGNIPALLTDFNQKKVDKHSKKKSKYKKHSSNADSKYKIHHYSDSSMSSDSCDEREKKSPNHKRTRQHKCDMYKSPDYDHRHKTTRVPPDSDCDNKRRTSKSKHKKVRQHDNKRLSPSSNSDSNDNRRASSRSKHERQHRSKRLPPSDSDSNDNKRASSRSKHERQHRSKRLSPSDSDSSGERRMSSRSKNEKERHHSSKRLSLSDSESGEERRRLSKSKNKARQHGSKRVSPSSDSDGGYEGRRTSSKRKYKGRHHTERRSRSLTSGSDNGRIISSKSRTEKDRCHVSRKRAYDESDSDHRLDRRKRRHV